MKKEITWTTNTGKAVKVIVGLITSKVIDADGDKVTVACCEMEIIAEIDGMGCVGTGRPQTITPQQGYIAKIGKLGIRPENLTKINAAIAEIEATPEWVAKVARRKQAEKEGREYEAHRAMMRRVMGY
jgi:hypothetical protein